MMKKLSYGIAMLFLANIAVINTASATVGGGQSLDVLGYDAKDQKVYLLRHYEDERGRLPQLYYYSLKASQPTQLIEVKSIYLDPKTQKYDYYLREKQVYQSIHQIKKRLIPLTQLNPKQVHVASNFTTKQVTSWGDPELLISQYRYQYQLIDQRKPITSKPTTATSYRQDLHVSQYYQIPKQNITLAVVKYFAFPEETGYSNEDALLLTR